MRLLCSRSPSAIYPIVDSFRAAGIEPNIVFQSDYNNVLQEFAASGIGAALMPSLSVNPHDERTITHDLGSLLPPRQIAIAWHRDRGASEALQEFVTLAARVGSELQTACASG
jgi:DNA-binding transcriptional LysR family regulator